MAIFLKKVKFLAIFWHSNANIQESQLRTLMTVSSGTTAVYFLRNYVTVCDSFHKYNVLYQDIVNLWMLNNRKLKADILTYGLGFSIFWLLSAVRQKRLSINFNILFQVSCLKIYFLFFMYGMISESNLEENMFLIVLNIEIHFIFPIWSFDIFVMTVFPCIKKNNNLW